MKHLKPLLVVFAVSLVTTCFSQEMPRHVFCSGGGEYEAGGMHASWTIGQVEALNTIETPLIILSSGFQQFDDQLVSVKEVYTEEEALVYPNPCTDHVILELDMAKTGSVDYRLYDFSGKILLHDAIRGNTPCRHEISVQELPPGIYNLVITSGDNAGKQLRSIKLIKN